MNVVSVLSEVSLLFLLENLFFISALKRVLYLAGVVSMKDVDSHSISLDVMPLSTGFLPMPSIRLSKYTAGGKSKTDAHSKVHPFPPGQVYNSTKSLQIHVIASVSGEQ